MKILKLFIDPKESTKDGRQIILTKLALGFPAEKQSGEN